MIIVWSCTCSCFCPIHWSQVLSREWRCSWSSVGRWCSNYIWEINNFIPYRGAPDIRGLAVVVITELSKLVSFKYVDIRPVTTYKSLVFQEVCWMEFYHYSVSNTKNKPYIYNEIIYTWNEIFILNRTHGTYTAVYLHTQGRSWSHIPSPVLSGIDLHYT